MRFVPGEEPKVLVMLGNNYKSLAILLEVTLSTGAVRSVSYYKDEGQVSDAQQQVLSFFDNSNAALVDTTQVLSIGAREAGGYYSPRGAKMYLDNQ